MRRPGRPKGRCATGASVRASLVEHCLLRGGEHRFLRPVNEEGEAWKILRVPAQGVATFRLHHCGRKIGERERW